MIRSLLLIVVLWAAASLHAQREEPRSIRIRPVQSGISLDGALEEKDWQNADAATRFWQRFPIDTTRTDLPTEVRILYDEDYIYLGAVCYHPVGNVYVTESLRRDFDPSRSGGIRLPAGSDYSWWYFFSYFRSDPRRPFTYGYRAQWGGFYTGPYLNGSINAAYQFRPFGYLALELNRTQVNQLPPYNSAVHWLAGPRLELTFARNLYFATLVQYNTQLDNMNINARLQWRYAPVSDFYIVYTDNYRLSEFGGQSRALIMKLTCWLNV